MLHSSKLYINNTFFLGKSHRLCLIESKGPVKLIQWVKVALLFLHVTSKLFQFTI